MRDHKPSQLICTEVLVREKGSIDLMSTKKQTPVNISSNHDRNISEVVSAQGNPKEDNEVVNEEGISTSKSPI